MNQNIRKSSAEIIAELDELTKDEVKDNRKILTDKESYHLMLYGILDRTKQDLEQDSTKFTKPKKQKSVGFEEIINLNDSRFSRHIDYIAENNERAYWDAVDFLDDGRLERLLKLIDPYMEIGKIKDEFYKRVNKNHNQFF